MAIRLAECSKGFMNPKNGSLVDVTNYRKVVWGRDDMTAAELEELAHDEEFDFYLTPSLYPDEVWGYWVSSETVK